MRDSYLLKFIVLIFILIQTSAFGAEKLLLNLVDADLPETIQLFAKILNKNILLSPKVEGVITLNLKTQFVESAFNLLLLTSNLTSLRIGDIWYITTQNEMTKYHEEELKWKDLRAATDPLITEVIQVRYGKAEDIATVLQDPRASFLSKRGSIRIDARTNSICLQDIPKNMALLKYMIHCLDVPVKQIMIKAKLASIDHDFEHQLGIDFDKNDLENENQSNNHDRKKFNIAIVRLPDHTALDIKLAAMENEGHAELISNPTLFTANQQAATIEAGEEVPYQEVSESGGTAVTFKKAVLGLSVIPQVLPGNKVLLQLTINQDRPSNKLVLGVPTISTRKIVTNVLVNNLETIVLGGVYETNHENGEQRIPFIANIPFIGNLFKIKMRRDTKRELLIFVTPKVITS